MPPGLRRATWLTAAAVLVAALGLADRAGLFGRRTAEDFETYHDREFTVVRVIDGDTFDIDCPDRREKHPTTRIRLLGVDTPETVKPNTPVQHFGPEASAFTKAMVAGKRVRLRLAEGPRTRGYNHRLLAYVILADGTMLNRELVAGGFAYGDPRFNHPCRKEFGALMAAARRARRGLWAEVKPSDLPEYLH